MKRYVRASTPADAPAIVALFGEVGLQPAIDADALHWKYWQARDDFSGPRSFVLTSGSDIIAHGALLPGSLASGTSRLQTGHVIDWVARRGAAGAGMAVMKYICQQVGSLFLIGGSAETQRILPHLGFTPAGVATAYVRPLFPLRMLRDAVRPSWRLLPRVARGMYWKAIAPGHDTHGWSARRLDAAEAQCLADNLPVSRHGIPTLERSIGLFRYVLHCPIVPMRLYAMERDKQVAGYFLLATAPGQVRIADCWMASVDAGDWQAMIHCAIQQAATDPRAAEIVALASDPLLTEALRAGGFQPRQQKRLLLKATGDLQGALLRTQLLDYDAAFALREPHEYWA